MDDPTAQTETRHGIPASGGGSNAIDLCDQPIASLLAECMTWDRPRLEAQWRQLRQKLKPGRRSAGRGPADAGPIGDQAAIAELAGQIGVALRALAASVPPAKQDGQSVDPPSAPPDLGSTGHGDAAPISQTAVTETWDQLQELAAFLDAAIVPNPGQDMSAPANPARQRSRNSGSEPHRPDRGRRPSRTEHRSDRFQRFFQQLRRSWELCRWRREHVPKVEYAGDLPVHARVSEIAEALAQHQVIVVCGETGSGKSTQLPKICLQAGLGRRGLIGHTQPRRIAARSVAARVAEELRVRLGEAVGFKIRFHDDTNERSFIKLMTDGILLAETQSDRDFARYDVIILDEAHERSLNIDFLLGYLRQVCQRRPEFRLIITSATIDAERFAQHFADAAGQPAPIIEVEGRGFPVDIQYRSLEKEDGSWSDPEQSVLRAVEEVAAIDHGHVLVFLPTERDILAVSRKLRNLRLGRDSSEATEVIPLYARLSATDQQRIFQPSSRRRIVLATNVAESSLTVPGIKYVIDTGTARISRYSSRSKIQRLPIEAISQASAKQRAGRCGRVGPGLCLRLYSREDFEARDAFTTPEIRRTNLASVILQSKMLDLGPLAEFPFLDPPRPEALNEGERSLFEIGAIDAQGQLTRLGRQLGRLPIDPRIGRMILEAAEQGCLEEVLIIAAALEVQDPRVRPVELAQAADQAHRRFQDPRSDFNAFLKLWQFYHEEKEQRSRSQFRKFLHAHYISPERMQQWLDVHRQLKQMVRELRLPLSSAPQSYALVHRSLLAGLLSGVAMLDEKEPKLKQYIGAGNVKFGLWPGCGLDRLPKWVMVAEIVQTSRAFGRTVAWIDPAWIEPLAKHLVNIRYSEPRWNPKSCGVTANQKVSLFGLPIVPRRRVAYGRVDPVESQLLMIAEGFFLEQWQQPVPDFLQHNWAVQRHVQDLCKKTRRLDWVVDEQRVVDFYAQRLPQEVVDAGSLNSFLKKATPHELSSLEMQPGDIISQDDSYRPEDYPEVLDVGTAQLPLHYEFRPGEAGDGVFVQVPAAALGQLSDQRLAWAIPGWLESKIVQMIRSLPKRIRRNLVPAPDTARRVAADLTFGQGSFYQEVATRLASEAETPLTLEDFDLEKVDAFLTLGVRVVDEQGQIVAEARQLADLRRQLGEQGIEAGSRIEDRSWQQSGCRDWEFGDLPDTASLRRGDVQVIAYPAVVDEGETVGLGLFDNSGLAQVQHRRGLVRLLCLTHQKAIKRQIRELPELDRWRLLLARWMSSQDLEDGLQHVLVCLAAGDRLSAVRAEKSFRQLRQALGAELGGATVQLARWLPTLATAVHQVDAQLSELKTKLRFVQSFNDARDQMRALMGAGFLSQTPWEWLQHYPRFLSGLEYRLGRLDAGSVAADQEKIPLVASFWDRYQQQHQRMQLNNMVDPQLDQFRWMIEEYRISLFAQPLGTSLKVSPQRLEKQWSQIQHRLS